MKKRLIFHKVCPRCQAFFGLVAEDQIPFFQVDRVLGEYHLLRADYEGHMADHVNEDWQNSDEAKAIHVPF